MGNFVVPKTPPSPTVPAGGAAGQILAKINDIDFNTQWINNPGLLALTSVGISLPTGLTVSNSPLTANGVLDVTYQSGYAIPTTASQANWDTAYSSRISSLTTTGSSGSATLVSNVLNIPTYTLSGLGGQPLATNLTSLTGLTFVSTSFVKMTAAGTFALDTNTYGTFTLPSLTSGSVLFSNGTTIAQDNANFFWDNTNKRLGIGTTTPNYNLTSFYSTSGQNGIRINASNASAQTQLLLENNITTGMQIGITGTSIGTYGATTANQGFIYSVAAITLMSDGSIIKFASGGNTERMRLATTGNVLIATTTDNGGKLQIKAPGAASTDIALRIRNSGDTGDLLSLNGNGNLYVGAFAPGAGATAYAIATTGIISAAGGISFRSPVNGDSIFTGFQPGGNGISIFSGNGNIGSFGGYGAALPPLLSLSSGFNPNSGTGDKNVLSLTSTIQTSGTYSGGIRGFYYNPSISTITGVTFHRAIETVTGDVILGSTSGNVGIGTTTPTSPLHIVNTIALAAGATTPRLFNTAYTINNSGAQTGTLTGIFLNATETALNGQIHNLIDLQVGAVSKFKVDNAGSATSTGAFTAGSFQIIGGGSYYINNSSKGGRIYSTDNSARAGFLFTDGAVTGAIFLQLGGSTSSFPAIKRNGVAIECKLADDSGYTDINAYSFNLENWGYVGQRTNSSFRITFLGTGILTYTAPNGHSFNKNLYIGASSSNASASLQTDSTTQGFLMPRMTYAQMKAISSPATGLQVYNTDNNTPQVYDGTGYQILGTSVVTATVSAGATTLSCDNGNIFSATLVNGTPTAITLSNARPGSYVIRLLQPAGGSSTVTWSTTIVWAGGSAPTLTTTANYCDIITLIYDGTTWRGVATLNFAS
jgi:hypothetical protein